MKEKKTVDKKPETDEDRVLTQEEIDKMTSYSMGPVLLAPVILMGSAFPFLIAFDMTGNFYIGAVFGLLGGYVTYKLSQRVQKWISKFF